MLYQTNGILLSPSQISNRDIAIIAYRLCSYLIYLKWLRIMRILSGQKYPGPKVYYSDNYFKPKAIVVNDDVWSGVIPYYSKWWSDWIQKKKDGEGQ